MSDVVLLHGTTQSPAGWDRLIAALALRGHRSWTVDLAGDAQASADTSADTSAEGYADVVRRQVPDSVRDPVVVAHSGVGLLLPAAARRLGAAAQVWLAAVVPDGRRSLQDELHGAAEQMFHPDWLGVDPTRDRALATHFLFHDCDQATLRWALGTLRAFVPARIYREPIRLASSIPSTYVVATQDRTIRPEWGRRESVRRLSAHVVEVDAGHCPHVSRPERVADLLDDLGPGNATGP